MSVNRDLVFSQLPVSVMANNNLSFGAIVIYGYLRSRIFGEEDYTFPSQQTISDDLGRSLTQVKLYLKELAEYGLIVIGKRKGITGNYNTYTLTDLEEIYGECIYLSWPKLKKVGFQAIRSVGKKDGIPHFQTDGISDFQTDGNPPTNKKKVEEEEFEVECVSETHEQTIDFDPKDPLEAEVVKEFLKPNSALEVFSRKDNMPDRDDIMSGLRYQAMKNNKEQKQKDKELRKQYREEEKKKYKDEKEKERIEAKVGPPEGVLREDWEEKVCGTVLYETFREAMVKKGWQCMKRGQQMDYRNLRIFWERIGDLDKAKKVMEVVINGWSEIRAKYKVKDDYPSINFFCANWTEKILIEALNSLEKTSKCNYGFVMSCSKENE